MHPFSLIEQFWWAGLPAALLVGIVLGGSPLAWPILATAVGLRAGTDEASARRTPWPLVALGGGITLVYALLGLLTGQLEWVINEVLGAWSGIGYIVLALGAGTGGLLLLLRPTVTCGVLRRPASGTPAALALGVPLGIVNCPACAGIITGVAVSAGMLGSTVYSVLVMVALGVGHTLTLIVLSGLSLNVAREGLRTTTAIKRLGGVLLLAGAAFFLFQANLRGLSVSQTMP